MSVSVPVFLCDLRAGTSVASLEELYRAQYAGSRFLSVSRSEDGYIAANALVGSNRMQIFVNGNEEQALLTACFDNLGKGASGAAVQNMNFALGLDEGKGLDEGAGV